MVCGIGLANPNPGDAEEIFRKAIVMLKTNIFVQGLIIIGLIAMLLPTGCSSVPKGEGAQTSQRLGSLADSVRKGESMTQATMDALKGLIENPENIVKQYGEFSSALSGLGKHAKNVRAAADKMANESEKYIKTWSEEIASINNEDIRSRSAKRQKDVEKSLSELRSHYEELADAFGPFMDDLRDIEKALQLDLTGGGIDAISSIANKAIGNGDKVLKLAESVANDFEEAGLVTSSITESKNN